MTETTDHCETTTEIYARRRQEAERARGSAVATPAADIGGKPRSWTTDEIFAYRAKCVADARRPR